MKKLSEIFRRSPDRGDEQALESFARKLWDPFQPDLDFEGRVAHLPVYIKQQSALAKDLMLELSISSNDVARPESIDRAWRHLLDNIHLIKRRNPRKRRPQSTNTILAKHRYDMETLRRIEKTGALFGVALQHALPGLEWHVGHVEGEKYIHEGQPILADFPGEFSEMNPTQVVMNVLSRSLAGRDVTALRRAFEKWIAGTEVPSAADGASS